MTREQASARRILIVGAGAVGQVYGAHLASGGAEVSVLVKPKYGSHALAGFPMHRIGLLGGVKHSRWEGFGVYTDVDAASAERWDQVWLCIPSNALEGDWLSQIAVATGEATVVSQHAAPNDGRLLEAAFGATRVVRGPIPIISYGKPLDAGDDYGAGMRYLLPPGRQGFSGADKSRARDVVAALRSGGMGASVVRDAAATYERGGALFLPFIASLELCGWTMSGARSNPQLELGLAAGLECAGRVGGAAPLWMRFWRPPVVRLLLAVAPRVMPLPIEAFFEYHFTKVGRQTELMLEGHVTAGVAEGKPMRATQDLLEALLKSRRQAPAVAAV